ncbi:MAG: hypothetical protein F2799_01030 [Actinobacteria bacterium]|nr:hypothetical protein [Actinomycetota bacterium]
MPNQLNAESVVPQIIAEVESRLSDFRDPKQEWRRLIAEAFGTFFLVLVAAGGPMMDAAFPASVGRVAAVVAPGLMVMAIIMFMGKVSGAHLNPAVSVAFALRRDFPWRRVPGYLSAQLVGALGAAWFLQEILDVSARLGGSYPALTSSDSAAFLMEMVLTLGLVSVILGTASGAQNIGIIGAVGIGGYVALAGLWASPLTGASMNPVRTLGPGLVAGDLTSSWVYVAGPLVGAALAAAMAMVLRGPGGGRSGSLAAQGSINPEISEPRKP